MNQAKVRSAQRDKVLQLLGGLTGTAAMPAAGYAMAQRMASPQTYRPRPQDAPAQLVRWVQAGLCAMLGLRLPLTGQVDAATRAALLRLQGEAGLPQTGAIDAETVAWLERALGLPAPHLHATESPLWSAAVAPPQPAAGPPPKDPDNPAAEAAADEAAHRDPSSAADETAAAAHTLWRAGESTPTPAQTLAVARLLQREALHAVMTLAVARDWLDEELARSGRQGSSGLLAEVLAWWAAAQRADPQPTWWIDVEAMAATHPHDAVERVRRAWREQHP